MIRGESEHTQDSLYLMVAAAARLSPSSSQILAPFPEFRKPSSALFFASFLLTSSLGHHDVPPQLLENLAGVSFFFSFWRVPRRGSCGLLRSFGAWAPELRNGQCGSIAVFRAGGVPSGGFPKTLWPSWLFCTSSACGPLQLGNYRWSFFPAGGPADRTGKLPSICKHQLVRFLS